MGFNCKKYPPEYPRTNLLYPEFFFARQELVFVGDVEDVEAEEDLIWRFDPPLEGRKASQHSESLQNFKRMSVLNASGLPCFSTLRVRSLLGSEFGPSHIAQYQTGSRVSARLMVLTSPN